MIASVHTTEHINHTFWDKSLKDFVYVSGIISYKREKPVTYVDPIGRTGKVSNLGYGFAMECHAKRLEPKTEGFIVKYNGANGEFEVTAARIKFIGKHYYRCVIPTQTRLTYTNCEDFFQDVRVAYRRARQQTVDEYGKAHKNLQDAQRYERKMNIPMRNVSETMQKALRATHRAK